MTHDDRLITCPECRSVFEAEDSTVLDLAKHDAEVLRAAAEAFSTEALGFSDKGWGSNPVDQAAIGALVKALAWLRERADRIEAQP